MTKNLPNPGSEEARKQGCTCPVMDNHYGRGYRGQAGVFAVIANCKLHASEEAEVKRG